MSTLLLGRICRTCLLESSTMHKLLDTKRDHLHIEEMLRKTVPNFDLSMDAEIMPLPVEICDDCWEKLQLSYDFQQLCMSSNERLKNLKCREKDDSLPSSVDLGYKDLPNEIGQQKDSSESVQECSLLKCREKENSLPSSVDLGYKDLPNEIGQQKDSSENVHDLQEDIKMEIGEELVTAVQLEDCILKKEETLDLEFLSDAESVKDYDDRDIQYKRYECKKCYKRFSNNKTAFDEHRRTHTEESPYLCLVCGKFFKTASTRWHHLEIHAGKNWQCPECPKRFSVKVRLRAHMSTHSKEKPFVCDICGSSFKRSDTLSRHKLTHEKPFKCKECNLSFVYERSLVHHKRTHTGEKPHTCTQCHSSYVFRDNLIRHLQTHLDKTTYFCDECPETFKYRHELRVHKHQHCNGKSAVATSGEETLEIA